MYSRQGWSLWHPLQYKSLLATHCGVSGWKMNLMLSCSPVVPFTHPLLIIHVGVQELELIPADTTHVTTMLTFIIVSNLELPINLVCTIGIARIAYKRRRTCTHTFHPERPQAWESTVFVLIFFIFSFVVSMLCLFLFIYFLHPIILTCYHSGSGLWYSAILSLPTGNALIFQYTHCNKI